MSKKRNFKIEAFIRAEEYTLLRINYFDNNSFNGRRILLYEGLPKLERKDFEKMDFINPNFEDSDDINKHLLACFNPNEYGFEAALRIIFKYVNL